MTPTQLSADQIKEIRDEPEEWAESALFTPATVTALCDLALEALELRAKLERAKEGRGVVRVKAKDQVFTYDHSPMSGGRYVTTISNNPPPPNLWCRVTKFTPAALEPDSKGVSEALTDAEARIAELKRIENDLRDEIRNIRATHVDQQRLYASPTKDDSE